MNTHLGYTEEIAYRLRSLYSGFGYSHYKMSKFEEYDLYARNKDFLISENVITFTDLDGKLMALKPDVTLSIVKNSKDLPAAVQKLCYHENVYRVTKGSHGFREILQVGLECLGNVDECSICEVLQLAARSLGCISQDSVLLVSHLGVLMDVLSSIGISDRYREPVLKAVGQKNAHELAALCRAAGVTDENAALLKTLVNTKGTPSAVIAALEGLLAGLVDQTVLDRLRQIAGVLEQDRQIRFDFSVVDDVHYYNGFVFKGFVSGVPESILSGGQYDKLMAKLGRKSRAIGFAVYMDALEQLDRSTKPLNADILLLYRPEDPLDAVLALAEHWRRLGSRVTVQPGVPENMCFGRICQFGEEGIAHA